MNDLNFTQAATLLSAVHKQATGTDVSCVPVDTSGFVAVAQATLKTGYDKVVGAISQVLASTIFSVRPYTRKFAGLAKNELQYGNHVRKITICDKDAEQDPATLAGVNDGQSVDHYKVNKPNALQTNFYGESVFMRTLTMFKHQLDVAFTSPAEFMAFVSACVQNVVDQMEKDHEDLSRAALANFIGGLYHYKGDRVVHLLTEYNAFTGKNLDAASVKKPENYPDFILWAMSRMRNVSDMLTERSYSFHANVDGKNIPRHSPLDKQKLYMLSGEVNGMEMRVFSSVFNDKYLSKMDYESVNFWQSIKEPGKVAVKPTIFNADGTVSALAEAVTCENVFAVLFDEEAVGYTVVNQWTATTPFNATGGYANTAWHFTDRYWNDFTENGVLFTLD